MTAVRRVIIGHAFIVVGFAIDVPKTIHVLDGYQGSGRADVDDAELSLLIQLAREEGVVLDPVYTGKAMAGLAACARDGRIAARETVVFLHSGGLPGLFANSSAFGESA